MLLIFGQMVNDPATIKVVSSNIVISHNDNDIQMFVESYWTHVEWNLCLCVLFLYADQ